MTTASTLSLVVRRARAFPAPVASVAINVLVVCTLVSGLAASLTLLQREALASTLAAEPPDRTVVAVSSPYAGDDPARQDDVLRAALQPVVEVAGGDVVSVVETGTYDVVGGDAGLVFAAVTGDGGRLAADSGRLPEATSSGPLEAAAPPGSGLEAGDRLTLHSRGDGRRVPVTVTGVWGVAEGGERWLADLDANALVVPTDRVGEVAASGTQGRWRAVPSTTGLEPTDLARLADAVAVATTELDAAGAELATSVNADSELVAVLEDRARELTVLRALLLVPAGLLVLVAATGLVLVAAGLADVRREEEGLLRSRGANQRQLVVPTLVETLLVCGAAALVAPPIASLSVRIGDVRPPLDLEAWFAAGAAALACGIALTVPVTVRALTGDRGQQLNVERQRRRLLTALVATLLLVASLGGLAVVELREFGASVAGTTVGSTGVDPLLVAAPALLLLAVGVVASVVLLPLWFRLAARLLDARGVSPALGSRFAARAPAAAVPLALAVSLASGTVAFGVVERASTDQARQSRAAYVAGADIRVEAPPDAQRAGVVAERDALATLPGVTDVAAVHRTTDFLDDVPLEMLMAELTPQRARALLGPGAGAWHDLVARPWQDESTGVALPPGTSELRVSVADGGTGGVVAWLAGPDGEVRVVAGRSRRGTTEVRLPASLREGSRLVALRTALDVLPDGAVDRSGDDLAVVTADGERLDTAARWWVPGRLVHVTFGAEQTLPTALPVVVTDDLASDAALSVGDTLTLPVFGIATPVEVAATVPFVRTVGDGRGGVLLDADTALPTLLTEGFADEAGEWWLDVADDREAAVTTALADQPRLAARVVTRPSVLQQLDDDPSTGGAALGGVLLLTGLGCLLVGALLLFSVVVLRRRERSEQARMLTASGADRRHLVGVLAWEYALIAGSGLVAGALAGVAVARTTMESMTLGPDGGLLVPRPELVLPWGQLLLPVAMVAVPLVVMALLAWRDHGRVLEASVRGEGAR